MTKKYLLHGKLTAKPGQRDALAAVLTRAAALVATARGCRLYAIGNDPGEPDAVFVTEIWDSREDHDQSLAIPEVETLISQALPILAGPPRKGQEIELTGGFGL